ncbi:hypothetical protein Tco_0268101 [Tanacetum coccineum]
MVLLLHSAAYTNEFSTARWEFVLLGTVWSTDSPVTGYTWAVVLSLFSKVLGGSMSDASDDGNGGSGGEGDLDLLREGDGKSDGGGEDGDVADGPHLTSHPQYAWNPSRNPVINQKKPAHDPTMMVHIQQVGWFPRPRNQTR